jgi:hypothetical protein
MNKKIIIFNDVPYTLGFPTVGQMIEIEQMKLAYTNGRYVEFAMSNLKNHIFILDYVDAVSYLSILIPELSKDLTLKSFTDVSLETTKDILKVYKEQFLPWFKPLLDDLYDYNKTESKTEENKEVENNLTNEQS